MAYIIPLSEYVKASDDVMQLERETIRNPSSIAAKEMRPRSVSDPTGGLKTYRGTDQRRKKYVLTLCRTG